MTGGEFVNPDTRGAANSLYRSTGRSSQRKVLREPGNAVRDYFDADMEQEGIPCAIYDKALPNKAEGIPEPDIAGQKILLQKRANASFEFFMRQRGLKCYYEK